MNKIFNDNHHKVFATFFDIIHWVYHSVKSQNYKIFTMDSIFIFTLKLHTQQLLSRIDYDMPSATFTYTTKEQNTNIKR